MNFIPKDKKFAKVFKFRFKNEKQVEHRSIRLIYGNYGLKAIKPFRLNKIALRLPRLKRPLTRI